MFGMGRLHSFLRLPSRQRYLFFRALYWLTYVRLGLRFLPFQGLRQQLICAQSRRRQSIQALVTVSQIIWAVQTSSRMMPGGVKCLAKALTTQKLMLDYGYEPEFKIGVSKQAQGKLEAHAWIEYQGHVVMGQLENLAQFTPLPPLKEP